MSALERYFLSQGLVVAGYARTACELTEELSAEGAAIHYEDNPDGKARLMFCLNRNDLYLLDNLSPKEEAIVTALLRTYGGLFTDFVYIDESLIAHQADTSTEQV